MALAALAAFWLATSGGGTERVEVVVADRDLRVGDLIAADDLRLVSVDIEGRVNGLYGSTDAVVGRMMVSATDSGEFVLASSTVESSEDRLDSFAMTVALAPERAPGELAPGESVDVFATWNSGVTELIAVDAIVIDVSQVEGGLVGGGDLRIRVQVADADQVEAMVHGHSSGDLTLVRSPADDDLEVGREYRPGESQALADDEDQG